MQVSSFKFTWFQGEKLHILFKRMENKFEGFFVGGGLIPSPWSTDLEYVIFIFYVKIIIVK